MADEKKPPSNKDKTPEAIKKHKVQTTLELRDPKGNTIRKNDAYKQTAKDQKTAQELAENNVADKNKESFSVFTEDMLQQKKGHLRTIFSRNKDGKDRSR